MLTEITDDQQASLESIPQVVGRNKYLMPPELYAAEKLRVERKPDEALRICVKFMSENFDHVPAMTLAAHILIDSERYGLAHPLMKLASTLEPEKSIIWNNLGMCYRESGDIEEAAKCFLQALKQNPADDIAWNNLSEMYVHLGEHEKAIRSADKAIDLNPRSPEARFNRGLAKLALGEFKEGWEGYEYNLGKHQSRRERTYGIIPRWTGVDDLTVIAYGEQGIGDEIAFASCIPDLQKKNKVIIECDHRLEGLFERSFGCLTYGTRYQKGGISWPLDHKVDASVAFGSLPGFYRNSVEDFPKEPFLKADPQRRLQWRALLDSISTKKKIGIAWTGGIKKTGAKARSMKLEDMEPILRQDATFISLQYKDASEEIENLAKKGIAVHQWRHAVMTQDYDDTAALVAELDLVICVTTAIVDLAGGLGVPCWVLTPKSPIWRFGKTGDKMPWYSSVKLYRQINDRWLNAISEVAFDLRKLCSPSSQS